MSSHLLNIAGKARRHFHAGQHFKYTRGSYHQHPEAVAKLVRTISQKILANVHDTIEEWIKETYASYLPARNTPVPEDAETRRELEEMAIALAFNDLRNFFRYAGASPSELAELDTRYFPQLNALTYRTYRTYEESRKILIDFVKEDPENRIDTVVVKIADSTHNSEKDRNLPTRHEGQNVKTANNLQRYDDNGSIFLQIFPQAAEFLRPTDKHRSMRIFRTAARHSLFLNHRNQFKPSKKASRPPRDKRRSDRERMNWVDDPKL